MLHIQNILMQSHEIIQTNRLQRSKRNLTNICDKRMCRNSKNWLVPSSLQNVTIVGLVLGSTLIFNESFELFLIFNFILMFPQKIIIHSNRLKFSFECIYFISFILENMPYPCTSEIWTLDLLHIWTRA